MRPSDVLARRLRGTLAAAAERAPADFAELLMTPGLGARTVAALAMVAEIVHGAPCRFTDPARFSLAHGGKDGHPFPVPLSVYDGTIAVMLPRVDAARLGDEERVGGVAAPRRRKPASSSACHRGRVAGRPHRARAQAAPIPMAAAACLDGSNLVR